MTKQQHPKDESESKRAEEQTNQANQEDLQPQKNPKDKSDQHEMHKSSHYLSTMIQQAIISNLIE
ncbi:hypothetical protein [Acinetobacter sp. YH12201]|jgi:hypothetical protein|uniref:hypothetical protein n=1 Tax=Acinetobacter sp. YH12201 TaxID=2601140 RepID=UPI00211F0DC6|nr:hypothetical protein [Acinetobacter sp. YH12201]